MLDQSLNDGCPKRRSVAEAIGGPNLSKIEPFSASPDTPDNRAGSVASSRTGPADLVAGSAPLLGIVATPEDVLTTWVEATLSLEVTRT